MFPCVCFAQQTPYFSFIFVLNSPKLEQNMFESIKKHTEANNSHQSFFHNGVTRGIVIDATPLHYLKINEKDLLMCL